MRSRSGDDGWRGYLADFHAERPGITAAILSAATAVDGCTPYDWVAGSLPRDGVVVDVAWGSGPLASRVVGSWIGFDRSAVELAEAALVAAGQVVLADAAAAPCVPVAPMRWSARWRSWSSTAPAPPWADSARPAQLDAMYRPGTPPGQRAFGPEDPRAVVGCGV